MAKFQKKDSVGKWLKKGEDFKDGDLLQIASEGQRIQGTFGPQDVFLMKTRGGVEANLSFNQTSINNIIDVYGEDSINWVGKKVKVWLILQSVSGKMQKVLYLTHPSAVLVEDATGFRFEVPPAPGAKVVASTVLSSKPVEKVEYPTDDINPDDIPF